MGYRDLSACVADLERHGRLVRVDYPIDPHLELAEIQRRLYRVAGPAVLFTRPKDTAFPMLANLFGTLDRTQYLFRDALTDVRKLVALKTDPASAGKSPWRFWNLPALLWRLRPKIVRSGPVLTHTIPIDRLPRLVCWPMDGGPFVTLPAVYTEHPARPGWRSSNLGMYRVQLAGNQYSPNEVGLHYQIHRGIGIHHAAAVSRGERLAVNVWVGGPPALTVSAVMPLPEGLPELAFAGVLGGRRLRLVRTPNGLLAPADADFVLCGHIDPTATKPEGPFGDHLGYYSLIHQFPVMTVDRVFHRPGAIWPFTVVGRPPQEDTSFGQFIHELTGPVIPTVLSGVREVHAVDAAGVHPLLLAIGSERYVPYAQDRTPQELLTQASAILGQGQLSLAKFLFLVAGEDDPALDTHNVPAFLRHLLERVDWGRDLHFHTRTTIDTLDYSAGEGLNAGSKLVVTSTGKPRRPLATTVPTGLRLTEGCHSPRVVLPGVLAVTGPSHIGREVSEYEPVFARLVSELAGADGFPLVTLVDDSTFTAASLDNWLWVTFTRADPAADVLVCGGRTWRKHHGGPGPLVIDARLKPHMPPPLVTDEAMIRRVDDLCARGGPLSGLGL